MLRLFSTDQDGPGKPILLSLHPLQAKGFRIKYQMKQTDSNLQGSLYIQSIFILRGNYYYYHKSNFKYFPMVTNFSHKNCNNALHFHGTLSYILSNLTLTATQTSPGDGETVG